jgi:hypothetical protein
MPIIEFRRAIRKTAFQNTIIDACQWWNFTDILESLQLDFNSERIRTKMTINPQFSASLRSEYTRQQRAPKPMTGPGCRTYQWRGRKVKRQSIATRPVSTSAHKTNPGKLLGKTLEFSGFCSLLQGLSRSHLEQLLH